MPTGTRIDYDDIAHVYDDRRRDHAVDDHLVTFLGGRQVATTRVADIGCGTGKQLASDRAHFRELQLIGIDWSRGMLEIARNRCADVSWVQGDGQAIPLADACIDYLTNQFSYPHVPDKGKLFREIFRVIKPEGRFVLTNIDPWAMPGWLVYRYFPESVVLDRRDFLTVSQLTHVLTDVGFRNVQVSYREVSHDEDLRDFLASVSRRHSASQLLAISDEAYAAGVRKVKSDIGAGNLSQPTQLVFVTLTADKR